MAADYLVNDRAQLVNDALECLTLTNPSLALDHANKIIYRRPHHNHQVSIVSGGIDTAFADLVGDGLLSAAVSGPGYQAPTAERIRIAIEDRVDTCRGVLVIAGNIRLVPSDREAFETAVQRTQSAGLQIKHVTVHDDVNVPRSLIKDRGRDGIGGIVLVHKIAGALAATGAPLEQVHKVAQLAANNLVSTHRSAESFNHASLSLVVSYMLSQMLERQDHERAFLQVKSNEPVLLINNYGGVNALKIRAITTEVVRQLRTRYSLSPVRVLSGTYMASLVSNSNGFCISILNVVNTDIGGPSMVQLLDAPCEAAGWPAFVRTETWDARSTATREGVSHPEPQVMQPELIRHPRSAVSVATSSSGEAEQEEEMEHAILAPSFESHHLDVEQSSAGEEEYEIV